MNHTMKTRIQIRRDTTENWLKNKDTVPAAGEPCFDLDTGVLKIGDGVTTYEKLKSIGASGDADADISQIQEKISALEASVGTKGEESSISADDLWAAIEEIKAAYEAADADIKSDLSENYYDKTSADSKIDEKISAALSVTYKPAGSIAFEDLPSPSVSELGKVYNITNSFTTTDDFKEGTGHEYPEGTNVVCVETDDSTYKWSVLTGLVDLSGYVTTSDLTDALKDKVDTVEGSSLVEDTLIEKLRALSNIKTTSSEFSVSPEGELSVQSIDQNKVEGLPDALAAKLTGVVVGSTPLKASDGVVTVPIATSDLIGVVKGTELENGVSIAEDGTMSVNSINISKLAQGADDVLVLDGGASDSVTV